MAQKFLTDIELTRGLKDSSGDLGTSGQVLSSTGTGLNWINSDTSASVVYQDGFTGDGSTTAFTLANSIDNENKTQVYIDGVYQHKDTYSLSNTTLTFSTAPPNSSDIEVISFSSVSSADDILYDTDFSSAGLMTTNGSGVYSITTNNSSNWNTAYTYSQVGHLPLSGGTLTGGLTGTTATFSASVIANGNSNSFGNTTVGALTASSISSSGSLSITGNTNSIGATTFTGNIDVNGTEILVGTNNTRLAENNLRFKAASDAYIDQNTVSQAIRFRTSSSSSLDRTPIVIAANGQTTFNSGTVNLVATFESTDGSAAIRLLDPVGNVELSNAGSMFNVQPSGGTSTFIVESNGRIRATDGTRALYMGAWDGTNNRIEGSSGHNILMTSYNADIIFGVNGTSKMIVDSDGNVVIGTSYDGAPGLTIGDGLNLSFGTGNNNESYVNFFRQASSAAAIMATGYRRSSTANKMESSIGVSWAKSAVAANYGQILFYTDPASTDSVGTVLTPTERMKIDSVGDIYNTASSSTYTKYGYNSIDHSIFGGDETTAFGASSLSSATAGRNSAFGFRALQDLTTGSYNTAIGGEALENITTGNYNAGTGAFALRVTTTSDGNTAMGYTALYNSQNDYNTGFGYRAGYGINDGSRNTALGALTFENGTVTGDDNTAVGHYALNSLGNASQNTAVGAYAGDAITTGGNNVAIGYKALSAAQGDSNNVAVGRTAMQLSSGAEQSVAIGNDCLEGATGSYNVAIGTFSGRVVTSGIHNTMVGRHAGYNVTTGDYNTFVGSAAGQSTTGGVRNVAIGYASLNGSTGSYNTAIGMETLNNNSLSYNTALGYEAGRDGDGQENTFVGYHAGRLSGAGNENTYVGSAAGYNSRTSDNSALGRRALYAMTTGGYNTAVGHQAGYAVTTGNHNTFLGERVGGSITTQANNTFLGRRAGQIATCTEGTFIGSSAGRTVTGSFNVIAGSFAAYNMTSGTQNNALGRSALYTATTASRNVAIGMDAMFYTTNSNDTIAIGNSAGQNGLGMSDCVFIGSSTGLNVGGDKNTAVGYQSMYGTSSSGTNNVSMGWRALHSITTGNYNVSVGSYAGLNTNAGSYNTHLGYYSGHGATSADNNTFLGALTGRFCTTGTQNTFVGSQAADNTTITGDGNTSLGFGSLHNIGDGDNNVCVGRNAGFLITTGNNNILIGEAAGNNTSNSNSLGIVTTGSNEIQMGNDDHTNAYIQISWTTVSDARDKGNITDIPYGLDFINQLNPKVYEFTNNREENIPDGKQRFGFLAQDVLEVEGDNPIIVNNTDENKLKMTNDYLVPVLVKAIQELKAEIETLKTQINN